jgi:outer membrane lipoprotein SlyB
MNAKHANLATIIPSVAGPVLGGFLGRSYGSKLLRTSPVAGEILGTIAGGSLGKYLGDELVPQALAPKDAVPPGAPYQIDPTTEDIPEWALTGARFLQPAVQAAPKTAAERWQDLVFGELPIYAPIQGAREQGWSGAIKGTLGQAAGGIGAGLAGLGAGKLLAHLLGRDINVPVVNLPLSHVIGGVAGTLGGTKGFQAALGRA